jgi:2-dehydropantoate 2-reductase
MSIHILGLGSIGILSAHLLRAAYPPLRIYSLPRRAQQSSVIYTVHGPDGPLSQFSTLTDGVGVRTPIDVLLVTTKAHQTRAAIEPHLYRFTNESLLVFLQNGMGVVSSIRDILPTTRIVLGTTTHAVKRSSANQVQWAFNGETLFASEPKTRLSSQELGILSTLGRIIPYPNFEQRLYWKLALNACINPVTAIYNVQNSSVTETNSPAHELAVRLSKEVQRVYTAFNPEMDVSALKEEVMELAKETGRNTSSMLADVLSGRDTEIDFINGYIVKMGEGLGIDVDENRQVVRKIKELNK